MNKNEMAEYILTAKDVADELGVTPGRIRQLVTEGRLDAIMRAGAWFFKPDAAYTYKKKKTGRPKKKRST